MQQNLVSNMVCIDERQYILYQRRCRTSRRLTEQAGTSLFPLYKYIVKMYGMDVMMAALCPYHTCLCQYVVLACRLWHTLASQTAVSLPEQ